MMNEIYRPTRVPPPSPLIWNDEPYSAPISERVWNDDEVRRGIEYSVRMGELAIRETTKILAATGLHPLLGADVTIRYAYSRPPVVYTPGCLTVEQECENRLLQKFAADVYDTLEKYFDGPYRWNGWFIAPYFNEGDDAQCSFQLGVFIDEKFNQTVVE